MQAFAATIAAVLVAALIAPAGAASFPVTIEHAFGETTIPEAPKRVVSIGFVEQDFLYALGISPVAVRDWWGDYPYATWPWAEEARAAIGAEPVVMPAEDLNLELILDQDPDLIVGVFLDMDQAYFDELSKIAPVVAIPAGYAAWSAPWQDELRIIDQATSGDTTKSDKIIADVEASIAKVRADNPQFAGKTGTNVFYGDGVFIAFGPEDSASRFLISLGLDFPPALEGLAGEGNRIDISAENLRLLDMDVAVWPINAGDTETKGIVEAMPLYQNLALAKEGRSVWLTDTDGVLTAAMNYQSPLALTYLIDKVPGLIAAAIDGDPATTSEPAAE